MEFKMCNGGSVYIMHADFISLWNSNCGYYDNGNSQNTVKDLFLIT